MDGSFSGGRVSLQEARNVAKLREEEQLASAWKRDAAPSGRDANDLRHRGAGPRQQRQRPATGRQTKFVHRSDINESEWNYQSINNVAEVEHLITKH